jgi:mono/diheme cytochrome c family protein
MTRGKLLVAYWTAILVMPIVLFIGSIFSQVRQARAADVSARPAQPAPIRATMSELHAHGGVPRGWKFLMPPGDAVEGRKVFVSLECFACHEVKGESFPQTSKTPRGTGPELTGMGGHHPAEYFAESIINPNRVIVQGEGYTGADRLSKMPSYADTMTIKQLVDVVAYLKSLTTGEMAHDHAHMSRSMTSGDSMKMK